MSCFSLSHITVNLWKKTIMARIDKDTQRFDAHARTHLQTHSEPNISDIVELIFVWFCCLSTNRDCLRPKRKVYKFKPYVTAIFCYC